MKNKDYYIIKAGRAARKGEKEKAVRWIQRAADEALKECRECSLMSRTLACIGM